MRLTLRTLLAYLDDALEPGETKEIGKKLQESPVAQALVSRIKEVMRRRRLGAPDLDGAGVGIDPNIVAQYLDNTLPPEQVGEVEKVFLESDLQLAEVAACHQILTIALGEPVEISKSSRERLYVLGPVDAGDKLQAAAAEPAHRNNGEPRQKTRLTESSVPTGPTSPSFEESLPDYLKPKPWSGRLIPIAVIVALLAVWIGAIVSDQDLVESWMGLRPAKIASRPNVPETQPETPENETPSIPAEVAANIPDEPETKPPSAVKPPAEKPPAALVASNDDAPADASPEDDAVAPPPPAEPDPAVADVPQPKEVAPAAPMPQATVAVQAVSPEGILLFYHPSEKRWYVVPRNSELKPGTMIACAEPFESVLEFDQGALRVTLLGDTVVELLKPKAAAPIGLRLISGRMILQSSRRDDKPWKLVLTTGPRTGVLEFGAVETICGVEFLSKEPAGLEQPVLPTDRAEGMYVVAGGVVWSSGEERGRAINKGMFQRLITDQPPLNFGPPVGSAPDWLDPQRRKAGSALRRWAKQFEKEFESNQPIDSSMLSLIRDSRPKISELAVRCLALTENPTAVVQALAQSDHEDARKAAMDGLRRWLGAGPGRGESLQLALRKYYERDEDVLALYRLLWGVSETDAKTQQASFELVEWLRSGRVEIRELAFANLVRLTGRKYDYRPLSSAAQREPAVKRWLDHVQREGAVLKGE